MGTEFQFGEIKKFWRWMVVIIAEQCTELELNCT